MKNFMRELPRLVLEAKNGILKRFDCTCNLDGVAHDVSIYWLNAYVVRVDFKTPKPKRSAVCRSAKGCQNSSTKRQSRNGEGKHRENVDSSLQGVTRD